MGAAAGGAAPTPSVSMYLTFLHVWLSLDLLSTTHQRRIYLVPPNTPSTREAPFSKLLPEKVVDIGFGPTRSCARLPEKIFTATNSSDDDDVRDEKQDEQHSLRLFADSNDR